MEVRRLWPGWMVAMVGRDTAGGSDTTIPPGFPFTKIEFYKGGSYFCQSFYTCSVGGVARVGAAVVINNFGTVQPRQIYREQNNVL